MTAELTIILLNYRRPANIPIILDSIRRQTIKPVVFLWNNGADDVNLPGVDRYESSSENVGCMVRWKLAREADTPYVMSLDDDLCFARDDALADVVESLRAMDDPARIVGPVGCRFGENPGYTERRDVCAGYARADMAEQAIPTTGYEAVDMVKGRSMALRRDRLDGLEFPEEREDDIFLSAALAGGRPRFHRIPLRLKYAFRQLPELGVANWRMPGHLDSRDRAAAEYFRPELPRSTDRERRSVAAAQARNGSRARRRSVAHSTGRGRRRRTPQSHRGPDLGALRREPHRGGDPR